MFGLGNLASNIAGAFGWKKRKDEETQPKTSSIANFGVVKEDTPFKALSLKGVDSTATTTPQPLSSVLSKQTTPKFVQDSPQPKFTQTTDQKATVAPVAQSTPKAAPAVSSPLGDATKNYTTPTMASAPKLPTQPKFVSDQTNKQSAFIDKVKQNQLAGLNDMKEANDIATGKKAFSMTTSPKVQQQADTIREKNQFATIWGDEIKRYNNLSATEQAIYRQKLDSYYKDTVNKLGTPMNDKEYADTTAKLQQYKAQQRVVKDFGKDKDSLLEKAYDVANFIAPTSEKSLVRQMASGLYDVTAKPIVSSGRTIAKELNGKNNDDENTQLNRLNKLYKNGTISYDELKQAFNNSLTGSKIGSGKLTVDEKNGIRQATAVENIGQFAGKVLDSGGTLGSFVVPVAGAGRVLPILAGDVAATGISMGGQASQGELTPESALLQLALTGAGNLGGIAGKAGAARTGKKVLEESSPLGTEAKIIAKDEIPVKVKENDLPNGGKPVENSEISEAVANPIRNAEAVTPDVSLKNIPTTPTEVVPAVNTAVEQVPVTVTEVAPTVTPRSFKEASEVVTKNADEAVEKAKFEAQTTPDVAQEARDRAAETDLTPQVENRPAEQLQEAAANNSPASTATETKPEVETTDTVAQASGETAQAAPTEKTTNDIAAERFARAASDAMRDEGDIKEMYDMLAKNKKKTLELKKMGQESFARVSKMSDDDIMRAIDDGVFTLGKNAEDMPDNIALMYRLQVGDQTPAKMNQLAKILTSIQDASSRSGQIQRAMQEAYQYLPPQYKAAKMIDDLKSKIKPNKAALENASPEEMASLTEAISKSDDTSSLLTSLRSAFYSMKRSAEMGARPMKADFDLISEVATANVARIENRLNLVNSKLQTATGREAKQLREEAARLSNDIMQSKNISAKVKVNQLDDNSVLEFKNLENSILRNMKADVYDTAQILNGIAKNLKIPGHSWGKRVSDMLGDTQRTMMLSALSGRAKDVILTTVNRGIIGMDNLQSGLLGSVYNKVSKNGVVETAGLSKEARRLGNVGAKATRREQALETLDVLRGDYVAGGPEALKDISKAGRDSRLGTGGNKNIVSRVVSAMTQAAPMTSAGSKGRQLARTARAEAERAGLTGEAARQFEYAAMLAPSDAAYLRSTGLFEDINLMRNGKVAQAIEKATSAIEKIPIVGGMIRNSTIPFGKILGNGIEKAATDRNVLYNVGKAIAEAKHGNAQGVVDQLGKLATNVELAGAAYLLWNSGILTTEDVNGDNYSGAYIKIGDGRTFDMSSLPQTSAIAAYAGAFANLLDKNKGVSPVTGTVNAIKQSSLSDIAGTDSPILKSWQSINQASNYGDNADVEKAVSAGAANIVGGMARQFVPAVLSGDTNSLINTLQDRNAPLTKATKQEMVTNKNGTQSLKTKNDVLGTEVNKTLAAIPFLQQATLKENPERANRNLLDRAFSTTPKADGMVKDEKLSTGSPQVSDGIGNWYQIASTTDKKTGNVVGNKISRNDGQTAAYSGRLADSTLKDANALNRMAVTKDELQSYKEDNKYSDVLGYYKAVYNNSVALGESKKETEKARLDYAREQVNSDSEVPYSVQELYDKTSQSEWRNMGNPKSDGYDPDTYAILANYDELLRKSNASGNSKSANLNKYSAKSSSSKSGKAKRISTSIGVLGNIGDSSTSKQTAKSISDDMPELVLNIPRKTSSADQIKTKTVKVTKGALA